ncbi:MAG: crossover junction endodeoxyribonuclease RuvC [Gammaproteobacteria bacterium]|nr:MAG: crossover junction endodeoxyribonuclease RuvC [Gammaproteobacteria bacterium]
MNTYKKRVIGIDPGSRNTGYGIVDYSLSRSRYVASGVIKTNNDSFPERLKIIFDGISQLTQQYNPDELSIEQVFVSNNANSALKLGQARGAAICAGVVAGLPIFEYSAKQVKRALVGNGGASKEQVQHMVKALLEIEGKIQIDASDALGICMCHCFSNSDKFNFR